MKFSDFLQEQKEKHAVMAFGRLNPPTLGHEKLVNKVKDIAKSVGGSAHIIVSHSQDPQKNPLSASQKLKHAKRAFSGVNVSASDPSAPHFLAQAAKLHKQGVTHFHMVGGQDRVEEFHKLLHRYNGVKGPHGSFNFKKIEVHSAGDRDPDAEGVEGMSASKMREHASKGNFNEFKKGVPSSMSHSHAKEMYNDVRRGMNIKEDINVTVEELLNEGVHDQAIFKAVFLAGGPGSGKDYVLDNTLNGHGLTEINSDKALEFLMDKSGLDKTMPSSEKEKRDIVRGRAKSMTELRQRLALLGRNGIIVNGTGDDYEKIKRIKDRLEEVGYDTSMIMVNTDDEVSKQRNIERGQRGGRTVPEDIRKQKWDSVQQSRPELAKIFGDRYVEFDNSEDLRQAPPDVVKAKKDEMLALYKGIKDFIAQPPKSEAAAMWVAHQMSEKDTLPIPQEGAERPPHPESAAAEEARKLGLQYYGFGRYGRNGKVTHRSVHDKLVEVGAMNEENNPRIPKKPGQPDKSDKHSDLYTDEDPKGTIHGLKFATTKDAEESVRKIKASGRSHAHKIQAAIAMEQRARVMKKTSAAAVYRTFINSMKQKTKDMNESQSENIDEEFEEMFAEDLRQWFDPKHPKGGWKRINSKGEAIGPCAREPGEAKPKCMSNEKRAKLSKKERAAAVSAKRRHDPNPERKGAPINVSNFGKGKLSESYQLSDSGALNLLLLGTRVDEVDYQIGEEKEKTKLLKDKSGKVRTFMLRAAAAKEAHTINGTVMPYKNGYVIKLNEENDHVSISKKSVQDFRSTSNGSSNESSPSEAGGFNTEGVAELTSRQEYGIHSGISELQPNQEVFGQTKKRKVSVEEIRRKQKEKVNESIDKGIEPGLSMATSGENLLRPSNVKNKQVKKPFEEMIGDGGEMLQSMADKKEDDLKKLGINLKSWKAKKFVG